MKTNELTLTLTLIVLWGMCLIPVGDRKPVFFVYSLRSIKGTNSNCIGALRYVGSMATGDRTPVFFVQRVVHADRNDDEMACMLRTVQQRQDSQ